MGDPDNLEFHVHDVGDIKDEEKDVGEDRTAESDSEVSTMNSWSDNVFCADPPFVEQGCLALSASAHWRVSFSVSLWGYDLWGPDIEWAPNSISASFNFTWKGVRFSGTVTIALESQGLSDWEVCITGEACVVTESWCISDTLCAPIPEP